MATPVPILSHLNPLHILQPISPTFTPIQSSQVLMAASMMFRVFWDIAPCGHIEVDWHFRGVYCHHYQGALMEAVHTSETSVNFSVTTWCYIPEDTKLELNKPCTRLSANWPIHLPSPFLKGTCLRVDFTTFTVQCGLAKLLTKVKVPFSTYWISLPKKRIGFWNMFSCHTSRC
jgi:hypothetical protein